MIRQGMGINLPGADPAVLRDGLVVHQQQAQEANRLMAEWDRLNKEMLRTPAVMPGVVDDVYGLREPVRIGVWARLKNFFVRSLRHGKVIIESVSPEEVSLEGFIPNIILSDSEEIVLDSPDGKRRWVIRKVSEHFPTAKAMLEALKRRVE